MQKSVTVQIHRENGPDEDFECFTNDSANAILRAEKRNPDTRAIRVIESTGRVVLEWERR